MLFLKYVDLQKLLRQYGHDRVASSLKLGIAGKPSERGLIRFHSRLKGGHILMIEQKIVPHLWFNQEAKEAAQFYTSIFPSSKITNNVIIHDTPSGNSNIVSFKLAGYSFMAINGGPHFQFNPSISFFVNFDPSRDENARGKLDQLWEKLSQGGTPLMPLQEYPFSNRYGWIQDKYGLTWQLILTNPSGEDRPFIVPSLLYVQDVCGKTKEASDFYISVFNTQDEEKSLFILLAWNQKRKGL